MAKDFVENAMFIIFGEDLQAWMFIMICTQ
jgi:hypothetical protein